MKKQPLVVFVLILAMTAALLPVRPAQAQTTAAAGPTDPAELEAFVDGMMAVQLENKHVAGAVISVVKDGELFFAKGYGYADVENRLPVDPERSLFRIGSISKLFTWISVMQLVEQGVLDLNTDVNAYIDFQIPATYPQPITLEHLLTHTPGFEDRGYGMAAASPEELIPNGEWLVTHMPARVRPPGQFAAYSNYGTSLAGYVVERQSGVAYDDYVEQHILQPLGMAQTTSRQPLPAELAADMSGGYRYVNGIYEAQDFELLHVAPAGSFSASATDMARFIIALLEYGRAGDTRILAEETARQMYSQLFTHDERLNGFAHGFYEMTQNGQWIIGHGGDTLIFHSLLALLPEHNVGVFVSCNSEGGSMLPQALVQAFVDRYYPAPEPSTAQPPADSAARLGQVTGSYRLNRSSYTTAEKVQGLFVQITVRALDDGSLLVSSPLGQQRFVEVEPWVFHEVGGDDLAVFHQDDRGSVTHAFLNSIPMMAIEKLAWYEAPLFHYILLGVCLSLFLSVLIVGPVGFFVARDRRGERPQPLLARVARWLQAGIALLGIVFPLIFVVVMNDTIALVTGNTPILNVLPVVPIAIIVLTIGAVLFTLLAWIGRYWNLAGRIHYTLVTLGAAAFVWFLYYWNLLGWRF